MKVELLYRTLSGGRVYYAIGPSSDAVCLMNWVTGGTLGYGPIFGPEKPPFAPCSQTCPPTPRTRTPESLIAGALVDGDGASFIKASRTQPP